MSESATIVSPMAHERARCARMVDLQGVIERLSTHVSERTERAKSTIKGVVAPDAAALQESGTASAPLGTSDNPSHAVLTAANVVTFCRFLFTLAFLVLFVGQDSSMRTLALTLYAVAACTDFLDGQIARRTQTVSWLGKVMDPIMDRVLLFTGVIGLMVTGELAIWVTGFVVGRDFILQAGAMWLRMYQTRPLDVTYVGKAATALLMGGFVDLLIGAPQVKGLGLTDVAWLPGFNGESCAVGIFAVYAGVACSAIAAVLYYYRGLRIRRRVLDSKSEGE